MPQITFMGAGSSVFARNIIGDCLLTPSLQDSHIALYDIDALRLDESRRIVETLNRNVNQSRATISVHHSVSQRKAALAGAHYVVNAIQIGGYEPATVIDFDIPNRYGLRQTIGDTLGIGGIFRALRTIPVMLDFARDMEEVCPNAWFLNYTNPMAMLTGAMLRATPIKAVGLCHSVQQCAGTLLWMMRLHGTVKNPQWKIAGINHMAWLLEITDGGRDLYPDIKARAKAGLDEILKIGAVKYIQECHEKYPDHYRSAPPHRIMPWDMVRLRMMLEFGYYITESSEHNAEYTPYWIKKNHPELIEQYGIPLDEYPRRCREQIGHWKSVSRDFTDNPDATHTRTHEYGSYIMEAMETDTPYRIGGNVLNKGLITNLPSKAVVEVSCLVDRNGVQPCHIGDVPEQCAALNRTNINVHLLTIEAALTGKKEHVYQAAMLDPHTSAELTLDEIRNMCDDLLDAHGTMIPSMR